MTVTFKFDHRLGISLPHLEGDWDAIDPETQASILLKWEKIRGHIPDRMKAIEASINQKQRELSEEEDFNKSCLLNSSIAELASIVNDLWIWYRKQEEISLAKKHS